MLVSHSKGKTAANAIVFVVLAVSGLALLNVLGTKAFKRFDTTAEKVYTLSPGSKKLAHDLPDRINAKLFVSQDLPPDSKSIAQFAQDLLQEYVVAANGKISLEVIKLNLNSKDEDGKKESQQLEEQARKYKIKKSSRQQLSANKFELGAVYLGLALDYHGNIQSIPFIEASEGLEFSISGLIKQLAYKAKKVAFASTAGALHPGQGTKYIAKFLEDSGYETISVDLVKKIPDDVDALLVVGPKQIFPERAKYVLDQFLMTGKGVGIFVDGQVLNSPKKSDLQADMNLPMVAQPNETGLQDLLLHYGVQLHQDLILDRQNAVGPVSVEGQLLGLNHPVFVFAGPLDQKHIITKGVQGVVLPYVGSLEIKTPAGVEMVPFLQSTPVSWRVQEKMFFIDPRQTSPSQGATKGPFVLGAWAQGTFPSFYAGKPGIQEDGVAMSAQKASAEEQTKTQALPKARLVVVADSDFMQDSYIGLGFKGLKFYMLGANLAINIVDWLTQDETLASVRNKSLQSRPIVSVSDASISIVKFATILGCPVLICGLGVARWLWRRGRRKRARLQPSAVL